MIPARFGLAIGDSRPVGEAVGRNCTSGRAVFCVSAGRRSKARAIGSGRRSGRRAGSRCAGCWLKRPRRLRRDADVEQPDAWRRASAARHRLIGSACPDGRRGGGGVRSATLRTIARRSKNRRPAYAPVAVVGTRTGGALACRPERAWARAILGATAYQRSSCAAARGAFQPLLRLVQPGTPPDAPATLVVMLLLICARPQRQARCCGGAWAWLAVAVGCARTLPSLIWVRDPAGWPRVESRRRGGVRGDPLRSRCGCAARAVYEGRPRDRGGRSMPGAGRGASA